jgi:hypothetical protein
MSAFPNPTRNPASSAARHALAALLLTSIHHAYGAYVYDTPWRYHVLQISIPAAVVILWSLALLRRQPGVIARAVFVLTILTVPVLTFGVFEGFYNHVLKNALYFGGASPALMARLFPPPTYELPNDVFFEFTGMLQAIPAALAAWRVYQMWRTRHMSDADLIAANAGVSLP